MNTLIRNVTEQLPREQPDTLPPGDDAPDLPFESPELGTRGFLPRLGEDPEPDAN